MTIRKTRNITWVALLAAFVIFVSIWEQKQLANGHKNIAQNAVVLAPSLWNLDTKGPVEYLNIACELNNYEKVTVYAVLDKPFLEIKGPTHGTVDSLFHHIGLIPKITLEADISHNGITIGKVSAIHHHDTIYTYLYVLLTLGLIALVVQYFFRTVQAKQTLEDRVKERTHELTKSEERLHLALEGADLGMWDWDLHTNTIYFSPRYLSMLGYGPVELPHTVESWDTLLHPEDRERVRQQIQNCLVTTASKWSIEFRLKSKKGPYLWVLGRGKIVEHSQDGSPLRAAGTHLDITASKNNEAQLRKSKEEWEKTFDAMSDIVTIQDKDMHIVRANKAAHDFFQKNLGELNGKHCYEIFTGMSVPCHGCPLLNTLEDIGKHSGIIHHKNLGRTFLVSSAVIVGDDGKLQYLVHVAKDITDQKRLEEELFQAHKMEAMGTLAGGIAHDFNNILSAIIGYAELALLDIPDDNHAIKDINQVLQSSKRAADLVQQILTFSRKADHQLHSLMPHLIVKEALKLLRSSLPTTLSLEEKIAPDCGSILADPTNIHQIVMNLCTNAFHAMENEKGTLAVSLYRKDIPAEQIHESDVSPGTYVVLSVSDTGQGMDKKTIERIFEPYFTTKEVGKGTGLGLAVIHGIVKDYKGFIQVESELGKGSIFQVYFPALEQVISTRDNTEEKPLSTGTERILVVDDESSIVNLHKTVLERLGYTATATTSSKEALEKIRLHPNQFDLLITDQTMPELSGVELAEEVLKIRPDMPIILSTGYSSVITEEEALAIGIRKYARKPVSRTTLAKAVREVLDDK